MKYLFTKALMVLIFCALSHIGMGQCNQELFFTTQDEIDNYFTAHPECTSLTTVTIYNSEQLSGIITNLNAFSNIISIDSLTIFDFEDTINTTGLQNLTQLNSLLTLQVHDFSFCANITHMDVLHIESDDDLNYNNHSLDLSGFDNLVQATSINLGIRRTSGSYVNVFPQLTSLNQLSFESVYYNLYYYNQADVINGFHALNHIEHVNIGSLNSFLCEQLTICNNAQSIGKLNYAGNVTNFQSFEQVQTIEDLYFISSINQSAELFNLHGVDNILIVCEPSSTLSLPNLQAANQIEISYGYWQDPTDTYIVSLPELENVTDFTLIGAEGQLETYSVIDLDISQLDSIQSSLTIQNTNLSELSIFENVQHVGGPITIVNNSALSECHIDLICAKIAEDIDLVHIENNTGQCIDAPTVFLACNATEPYISGQVYIDINCNNQMEATDLPIAHPILLDANQNPIGNTGSTGQYIISNPTGGLLTFAPQAHDWWLPISPFTIDTDTLTIGLENVDFALCPNPDFHDVEVHLVQSVMRPGFITQTMVYLNNVGVNEESVTLNVNSSLFSLLTNWNSNETFVTSGSQLIFEPILLAPFEQRSISISAQLNPSASLGIAYTIAAEADINQPDINPSNNTATFNGIVVGSYDPNDIQVNLPLIDVEQADPAGDWLTYRIRFQNTGNFPAEFVNVVSVQDELVDMGTIQMIDASHDNSWSFDGREVTWFFDNIQLPDSLSDPEGSQGYIIYKVRTQPSLGVGDVLDVNAAIYFDFNEPVITNTTTTEYYLCPEELTLQTNDASICEYDIATLTASSGYDNYTWSANNIQLSNQQTLNYTAIAPGNYTISCMAVATPDVCQSETSINIEVIAVPETPIITQEENTLTASGTGTFVWSLNGEVLNGSTNVLEMTETGTYSVYIDGDCPSGIATGFYTYTGIEEDEMLDVVVYPNPAQQWLRVEAPFIAGLLVIRDMVGRKIYEHPLNTTLSIDLENWPNGAYVVAITTETGIITRSFVKQ